MKLSTKGRYAVRIMLNIARNQGDGPVRKALIAEEENISKDYIEQLMVPLKKAKLVESLRGVRGGFLLARAASDISLHEILLASEGDMALVGCKGCKRIKKCPTHPVWNESSRMMEDYFSSISLQSLLK